MKQGLSVARWILDKLLRLAAALAALVGIPIALIGGSFVDILGTTLTLVAGAAFMVFGFVIAFFVLVASLGYWPEKSKRLKAPALILLTMIYVSGACGLGLAGAGVMGLTYAKSHGFLIPARVDTAIFRHASQ